MSRRGILILLVSAISVASSCAAPNGRERAVSEIGAVTPQGDISAQGRQAGERFFMEHEKAVEFAQVGPCLRLANRWLGMEFMRGEHGYQLSRLYGIEQRMDFLPASVPGPALWRITLRRDKGRDKAGVTVSSTAPAEISSRVEEGESAATLHLQWHGLDVAEDRGCMDVEASVTVTSDDPFSQWRMRVVNRSETYGLWEVMFPIVALRPIGDRAEDNRFVWPYGRGIVIGKDAFMKKARYTGGSYPSAFNMQFQALYNERSGAGLYLAAYDGQGYSKRFSFSADTQNCLLDYSVSHYPQNMGFASESFEMPYDVRIGPFAGDWYDACQIYRKWAVSQVWCSKGPKSTRSDMARWYKEAPVALMTSTEWGDSDVLKARDSLLKFLSFIGTDLPIHWYTWKKHVPDMTDYNSERSKWSVPDKRAYPCSNIHDGNYPTLPALDSFSAACEEISKAGGHVKPYVCSNIFDPGVNENSPFAAQAKPNTALNVDGGIQYGEGSADVAWRMCPHSEWWQNRLSETAVELVKREHAGGIYFDCFYGGVYQCFSEAHGHTHGGGTEPYLGDRKLATAVRQALQQANPEAVMSGESPCETAIDLLDGFQYVYTVGSESGLEHSQAPLFATVYGDYICRCAQRIQPESDGFYIQCASLFTEGCQMGRLYVRSPEDAADPKYADQMAFLRRLASYWKQGVGGKYLAYGRLLRPLKFTQADPMPDAAYVEPRYNIGRIAVQALQSAVFQSPDGGFGVFLVNVTDKALPYKFELAPGRYPISGSPRHTATEIDETGRRGIGTQHRGTVRCSGSVDGRGVVLLEITTGGE